MRKTQRTALVGFLMMGGLILLVAAAWGVLWFLMEPVQDGQPISYWISRLGTTPSGSEAALNKLGPEKTMPYLLRTIRGEDPQSTAQRLYRQHYGKIPVLLRTLRRRPRLP